MAWRRGRGFPRLTGRSRTGAGQNDPALIRPLELLGAIHLERDEFEASRRLFSRAVTLAEEALEADDERRFSILMGFALALDGKGRPWQALEPLERVVRDLGLDRLESALGPDDPVVVQALVDTSVDKMNVQGLLDEAIAGLERALDSSEPRHGPDHPGHAIILNNLGSCHIRRSPSARLGSIRSWPGPGNVWPRCSSVRGRRPRPASSWARPCRPRRSSSIRGILP